MSEIRTKECREVGVVFTMVINVFPHLTDITFLSKEDASATNSNKLDERILLALLL